jgi:hypothetical protein
LAKQLINKPFEDGSQYRLEKLPENTLEQLLVLNNFLRKKLRLATVILQRGNRFVIPRRQFEIEVNRKQ